MIYHHLVEINGIHVTGSHWQVLAAEATETDAETIGAKLKEPVLVVQQLTYTDEGAPFEYNVTHFPFRTTKIIANVEIGPNWSQRMLL